MTDNPETIDKFKAACDSYAEQPLFKEMLRTYVLFYYDTQKPKNLHKGTQIHCPTESLGGIINTKSFDSLDSLTQFVLREIKTSNFLRRAYKKDQTGAYKMFTGQKK